jgi:hypothetical protein
MVVPMGNPRAAKTATPRGDLPRAADTHGRIEASQQRGSSYLKGD